MDTMLSKALRDFMSGPLNQLIVNLAGQDGALWEAELNRFNRKEPCWGANPTQAPTSDCFRLMVDYKETLEQMIAAGRYDWTNSDITPKRFPIQDEGTIEFEGRLFHFDRDISSENAKSAIEAADTENPWMVGKIEHLLAFGKTFPEVQRRYPIIGLGSVAEVYGGRNVPYLHRDDSGRRLPLGWWGNDWNPICRFLAVRKVSVS